MNIRRIAALLLGVIVIVIGNAFFSIRDRTIAVPATKTEFTVQQREIIEQLQTAKIVYVGEIHDRTGEGKQQLGIIQALFQHQPRLAIGMEMFQRPAQPFLDRYLAGKITEVELRQQTEFDLRWGYSWENYLPLLKFAKANRLPVIALNTPTEITRKVAKQGLESLEGQDFQYIPPIDLIDLSNTQYQARILASYQEHAKNASINSKSFHRFYAAQVLWDETMAARIADFVTQQPDYQVIVLAGQAHILYGHGIPDRVRRRLGPQFTAKTLILHPDGNANSTDFIWHRN